MTPMLVRYCLPENMRKVFPLFCCSALERCGKFFRYHKNQGMETAKINDWAISWRINLRKRFYAFCKFLRFIQPGISRNSYLSWLFSVLLLDFSRPWGSNTIEREGKIWSSLISIFLAATTSVSPPFNTLSLSYGCKEWGRVIELAPFTWHLPRRSIVAGPSRYSKCWAQGSFKAKEWLITYWKSR